MALSRLAANETVQIPVPKLCDLCDSVNEVNWYCRNCAQKLCDNCKKSHLRITTTHDHVIVHGSEGPCLADEPTICHEHRSTLAFYCRSCDSLSCAKCLVKHHNGHNFSDTDDFAREVRNMISSLIVRKEKEEEERLREIQTIKDAQEDYLKNMDASRGMVKRMAGEMILEIRLIEAAMLSDISQWESEGVEVFHRNLDMRKAEESHLKTFIQTMKADAVKQDNIALAKSATGLRRYDKNESLKGSPLTVPFVNVLDTGMPKESLRKLFGTLQIREKSYCTPDATPKRNKPGMGYCKCALNSMVPMSMDRQHCTRCGGLIGRSDHPGWP